MDDISNSNMRRCVVETLDAGFTRRSWATPDGAQAEVVARKLSVAAIENPNYPNPFFILETDGSSRCHWFCGKRSA